MRLVGLWLRDEAGASFVEFALLLPILGALLLGTADLGSALVLKRKLASATQTAADLLTREDSLNPSKVTDALRAGELILQPNAATGLGSDVVGVQFRVDTGVPVVSWRRTTAMAADTRFPAITAGLGGRGEGVIGVVMTYTYQPIFSGYLIGPIAMREMAILRGRKLALIPYTP